MINKHALTALVSAGALVALLGFPATVTFAHSITHRSVATTSAPSLPSGVQAQYGNTEWGTANAIAQAAYPHGTSTAVLTSGLAANWADGLVAAPLASALHAPILMTQTNSQLGQATLKELDALGVTKVYLVGAVGTPTNASALQKQLPASMHATAIGGTTAYATSGLVAQALAHIEGVAQFKQVFVSSGVTGHLVDALAADPVASAAGAPILLVPSTGDTASLNATEQQYLNSASQAIIVGAAQGYSYANLPSTVQRTTLYGKDRAGTAAAIDRYFAPKGGYSAVFVTNGVNAHIVDALSAGPLIASDHAAMVEVYDGTLPPSTAQLMKSGLFQNATQMTVVGGPASIPSALYDSTHAPLTRLLSTLGLHPQLKASTQTLAQGTAATLSVTGIPTTQTVAWSVTGSSANSGVLEGNGTTATFVGTAPGNYTIQADVAGQTLTSTLAVYGKTATGFTITSSHATLAADGQDTAQVTIQAVDRAGTVLPNWNGTVAIQENANARYLQDGAALPAGPTSGTGLVTLTNGTATLSVGQVTVPGTPLNLQLSDATAIGGSSLAAQPSYGNVNLTTVLPVATALKWSSLPKYLASNLGGTTTNPIPITVVDQAGYPMISGVTPITVQISGAGTLANSRNNQVTVTYNGNLAASGQVNTSASVSVAAIQGKTGPITLTASAHGLSSASATLNAVIAGVPTQVVANLSSSSLVTQSATPDTLTLQAEDAQGVPVADTTPAVVTITPQNRSTPTSSIALTPSQGTTATSNSSTYTANARGTWTFAVNDANAVPGTYTIMIAPSSGVASSFPVQTLPLVITAGSPTQAQFVSPAGPVSVAASDPTVRYTLQLTDRAGNPVAQAGVTVNVWAVEAATPPSGSTYGQASLNGVVATAASPLTVTTNAQGQALVTLVASGIPGAQWQIHGTIPTQTGLPSALPVQASSTTTVAIQVPAALHVALTDASAGADHASSQYAKAGNTVDANVSMVDQYGIPMSGKQVLTVTVPAGFSGQQPAGSTMVNPAKWVYGGTNTITLPVTLKTPTGGTSPTAIIPLKAWSAGSATVTMAATGTATPVQQSASMFVQAGPPVTAGLFQNGIAITTANPLAVTANTPVALTVMPTDTANNPTTATYQTVMALHPSSHGSFRTTPSGASISTLTLPVGSSGQTVYYVSSTTGSVVPTASLAASGLVLVSPAPNSKTGSGAVTIRAGAATTITATVYGPATASVTGQTVTASVTGGGSIQPAKAAALSSTPSVSFTYTAPATGSGHATITLTVPGQAASADDVLSRTVFITY